MKDQELKELFHAYRPKLSDEDAFMDRLIGQMDAADESRQQPKIIPLYRKIIPWAAGIAAAAITVVWLVAPPSTPAIQPQANTRLPQYHYYSHHASSARSSYDDIVNEIEASGRELEQAIAQL